MTPMIELKTPFIPYLISNSYRYFEDSEKHVTRICNSYVLIFMLKNELYFKEDGQDIVVKSGEWYLQAPGLLQEGVYDCPNPEYYYVHFNLIERQTISSDIESPSDNHIHQNILLPRRGDFIPASFITLFDKMEKLSSNPYDTFNKQMIFYQIIKHILDTASIIKSPTESLADQIVDYINKNFCSITSCKLLREIFHYSDDHITNIVKKYYGITPWQYVQKLRINNAMELLTNTNYSVKNIADNVGYKDLSVFYKAFKQHTNFSPKEWRSNSRCI